MRQCSARFSSVVSEAAFFFVFCRGYEKSKQIAETETIFVWMRFFAMLHSLVCQLPARVWGVLCKDVQLKIPTAFAVQCFLTPPEHTAAVAEHVTSAVTSLWDAWKHFMIMQIQKKKKDQWVSKARWPLCCACWALQNLMPSMSHCCQSIWNIHINSQTPDRPHSKLGCHMDSSPSCCFLVKNNIRSTRTYPKEVASIHSINARLLDTPQPPTCRAQCSLELFSHTDIEQVPLPQLNTTCLLFKKLD